MNEWMNGRTDGRTNERNYIMRLKAYKCMFNLPLLTTADVQHRLKNRAIKASINV